MSQCSTLGPLQTAQELVDVTLASEDEGRNTDAALPEGWRLKTSTPDLPDDWWTALDLELCQLQGLLHHDLGQGTIPAHQVADQYGTLLTNFLSSKEEFKEEVKVHRPHRPAHQLEDARKTKNSLRKEAKKPGATQSDKKKFNIALKFYNFLQRKAKDTNKCKTKSKHEKLYKNKFFKFAKSACNGTLDSDLPAPEFSKAEADKFFSERYSKEVPIDLTKLDWFPEASPPEAPYPETAITPRLVKHILKGKRADTAPGEDGLLCGILASLPSVHHFLATLYWKVDAEGIAPSSWAGCNITLSLKAGSPKDPSNFRPIALSSILGKVYHQIKADQLTEYMLRNKYINPAVQKAFLRKINGCVEHIQVIQEIIQDAKHRKRSVHFTFVDLEDAFGSVNHKLIQYCLEHFNVPEKERKYIKSLYSQLHGKVVTKEWVSKTFRFLKGIAQGDNYSSIIFLTIFQPLISFIESKKETLGYQLGAHKVITKPFADDFETITNNKKQHQILMDRTQEKASTMGLTYKPSKCRTLSIQGGKVTTAKFFLKDKEGNVILISNLEDDPAKFLGSVLTHHNSPADHATFLRDKLEMKLSNLDKAEVKGENKVAVYSRYVLPSLRFHLTVHNIHHTHLEELDGIARRYLKKWLEFPTRGVSDLSIFHPSILGIQKPSQVYLEGHLGAHLQSRLLGDPVTKEALQSRMTREEAWTNKSSTIMECEGVFREMELEQHLPLMAANPRYCTTIRVEMAKYKKEAKKKVQEKVLRASQEKAKEMVLQGEFGRLLEEQECNVDWQSMIHCLPRGVLAFAARATSNSLPSPDNLARWKKVVSPRCPLCDKVPCTLFHLLSNCPTSLQQGRYDYRHDSILNYLYSIIRKMRREQVEVYCDLEGSRVNGVTIPPNILITASKPDLVLVDRSATPTRVDLVELTVPWDSGADGARMRKELRYATLVEDIREKGLQCHHTTLEIGARGLITPRNRSNIAWLCSLAREGKVKRVTSTLSKLALLGSYSIWVARRSQDWTSGSLLKAC